MRPHDLEFRTRAVSAWVCVGEAWRLIRDEYWFFLGVTFFGVFIGALAPMGILVGPAMCGIHLCFLRRERGLPVRFEMFFDGFHYFAPSLIATLIMLVPEAILFIIGYPLIYVVLFGGAFVAIGMNPPPQNPAAPQLPDPEIGAAMVVGGTFGLLIVFVCIILLQSLFLFVYPLIVDKELSGWEAIKLSCRAAWANLGGVVALMLLRLVLELTATLVFCVGPFFLLPLDLAMVLIAYRHVFPADDEEALYGEREPLSDDDEPQALPAPSEGITATPKPKATPSAISE